MNQTDLIDRVATTTLSMQRHSWEQGTVAQAFVELGRDEVVIAMAYEAAYRQIDDGRLAMVGGANAVTDPAANGVAVLRAYELTGDEMLRRAADEQRRWLMERAPRTAGGQAPGTLYHITHRNQVWVDSYYMAPPFLAVAGEPEEAVAQIEGFRTLLWSDDAKLFHHQWDEDEGDYSRAAFWGVGNGWAAAGMTRVIAALPDAMGAERQRLIGYVHDVVDGCLAHLRPDGLFHDVVDDPDTFVETNLGQMLAYTIYRGVAAGWMDDDYVASAERMRAAAVAKVDDHGFVQGVCGAPHFDHPGVAPEGQAFFLLMHAAWHDYELARPSR
jgi:rhamnogalacturonyl hydrolase YesR